jgi:hypothetical protein
LVERRPEKAGVASSILAPGTIRKSTWQVLIRLSIPEHYVNELFDADSVPAHRLESAVGPGLVSAGRSFWRMKMTKEELRTRLWEVEKELAESRHVLEILIRQHLESQLVVGAVLPFVPEMIAKMSVNTLQQYKEQAEKLARSIKELPESD